MFALDKSEYNPSMVGGKECVVRNAAHFCTFERRLRWILWDGHWGEDLRSTSGLQLRSQDAIGQAVRPSQYSLSTELETWVLPEVFSHNPRSKNQSLDSNPESCCSSWVRPQVGFPPEFLPTEFVKMIPFFRRKKTISDGFCLSRKRHFRRKNRTERNGIPKNYALLTELTDGIDMLFYPPTEHGILSHVHSLVLSIVTSEPSLPSWNRNKSCSVGR